MNTTILIKIDENLKKELEEISNKKEIFLNDCITKVLSDFIFKNRKKEKKVEVKKIELTPEQEKIYSLKSGFPPCIVKGCEKDTYGGSRGMCMNHYAVQQAKVKRGITTWEQLEKEGAALPKTTDVFKGNRRKRDVRQKRVWLPELGAFVFLKKEVNTLQN